VAFKGKWQVKSFFQLIATFFDWTRVFAHSRKSEIDWKEIGQMRSRLVQMRFEHVSQNEGVEVEVKTAISISMRASFRNLSNKDRDLSGLKRWCKSKEEEKVLNENHLRERLYHSERAHRERQESGQYAAISREDLEKIQECSYELSQEFDAAAKEKLERFLSGSSDNLNDMLFAPLHTVPDSDKSDLAATIDRTEFQEVVCEETVIETTPTSAMDVVAKLEDTIRLDAVGGTGALTPVSLPATHYINDNINDPESTEKGAEEPISLSARLVRTAKVTPLRGRTRKQH
jgi:hypothetical protein